MAPYFTACSQIRRRFASAMSDMYREEVPAYGKLVELVEAVNAEVLARGETPFCETDGNYSLDRISQERHGAIRLDTAEELRTIRRIFGVIGMMAVGYYDLDRAMPTPHQTHCEGSDVLRQGLLEFPRNHVT